MSTSNLPYRIDNPEKIGIGLWDKDSLGTALNDVDRAKFNWYYNWDERALWDVDETPEQASYAPMVWGGAALNLKAIAQAKTLGATTLLGFNEPDDLYQANMSVEQAVALWSQLEATGLRLGSPAPTQHGVLGANSWLGRFMAEAEKLALRVDFIAVHYFSQSKDVKEFKAWLEAVHQQYNKPIWVTEWCLADWSNPGRFTEEEQAAFALAGAHMMDDLPFIEKHAWFAAYEGGDGWNLNSGLFDQKGNLTKVGQVFDDLNSGRSTLGEAPPILISQTGTSKKDKMVGGSEHNEFKGRAGNDVLSGKGGNDRLWGSTGNDTLTGGAGEDVFAFDTKPNKKANLDTITDFTVAEDSIWLDNKIFTKLGKKGSLVAPESLNEKFFATNAPKDKNDYIIYDKKSGYLSYDADGSGSKYKTIEFALLKKGLALSAKDIFVI
ncbi:glycosyl hydrolase [Microvirga sp. BSC39]|uniref:glycosyl hydrolase n=1 Tax=Microvirga sp. BSC39 TaxID=1549810 RepID=UPI00068E1E55|nr:glycosyl hydrolase [Microvirga sp. BSC39]